MAYGSEARGKTHDGSAARLWPIRRAHDASDEATVQDSDAGQRRNAARHAGRAATPGCPRRAPSEAH